MTCISIPISYLFYPFMCWCGFCFITFIIICFAFVLDINLPYERNIIDRFDRWFVIKYDQLNTLGNIIITVYLCGVVVFVVYIIYEYIIKYIPCVVFV